jgi:hypothetical protein
MSNPDIPPKRHGCFFYGCVTCLVLCLLVVVTAFFTVRYGIRQINAALAEYTDTAPMPLPKVEMSPTELEQLQKRLAAFNESSEARTNTPPLILTAREINVLLAGSPEMQAFKNRFYVSIETNQIRGLVSLPLDNFKIPFLNFKGRYLNGAGVFAVQMTNNELLVRIDSLEVKGKRLPENYLAQLRQQNLAQDADNNPTNAAAISNYKSIEIKDGKVIIEAKEQK